MHFHFVSIFPHIFDSFLGTSLIAKARAKGVLSFSCVDPRDFCTDKHKQIDDTIYGGGAGLLMKAEPMIQAVEHILGSIGKEVAGAGLHEEEIGRNGTPKFRDIASLENQEQTGVKQLGNYYETMKLGNFLIVFLTPSQTIFNQQLAYTRARSYEHIIFVCGRYEGVDHRFVTWMQKIYPDNFVCVSLGQFVLLGGEVAAMTMTEAIARLIPGVIKETASWQDESYSLASGMTNIEYPHYTRPEVVRGQKIPDILLSGHHKEVERWRKGEQGIMNN